MLNTPVPDADRNRLEKAVAILEESKRLAGEAALLLLEGMSERSPGAGSLYDASWLKLTTWVDAGPNPNDLRCTAEWTGGGQYDPGSQCVLRWPRGL